MWASIISAILPLFLQIVMGLVKNSNLKDEQKIEFIKWIELAGKDLGSVKLQKAAEKQLAELNQKPFVET